MDNKIKEILDRIMTTAETVYETAGSVAKETGKKLSEKKDLAKCRTRIMRLRDEMEECFTHIGRLIYDGKNGDIEAAKKCESDLAELFDEIDGKQTEIKDLKLAIEKLSSERRCEGCGRMNPKDYMFCPECGTEQPEVFEEEEETTTDATSGNVQNDDVTPSEEIIESTEIEIDED